MSRSAQPLVASLACLAMGCTPLRPLDGSDDAGGVEPTIDARSADAFDPTDVRGGDAPFVVEDASRRDAPVVDAPGLDAPGLDAWSPDAALPDARASDAWASDAWASDAWAPWLADAWTGDVGPATRPTSAGEIVVTELMIEPDGGDENQWVEVHNPSSARAYDLEGCRLAGMAMGYTIPTSLVIAPRDYVTLAARADPGFSPDHVYPGAAFQLNPTDRAAIECGGVIIDEVVYDFRFPSSRSRSTALEPAVVTGIAPHIANDDPDAWCETDDGARYGTRGNRGTPGAPNVCR